MATQVSRPLATRTTTERQHPQTCYGLALHQLWMKRALDLVIAVPLLLLSIPIAVVIGIWICLSSPGPILFRQSRIGWNGKPFTLLKFRSMRMSRDVVHRDYARLWIRNPGGARQSNGSFKLAHDDRVTTPGRFLRKFSLDELPQLINVLLGEMSLVGPRPALPYEVAEYENWHRARLATLPGMTGLWQVSGRNQLSFEEMIDLDLEYIRTWTPGSDLRILARTIPVVLCGTGI
jgi:lipopolysaccharide/colanic/teichoic acid biosynthesis glycosyltransferase